ncbi:5-oxoprolinase subunit PxpB [Alteromonadaceae bacterium M269]|nr:5-oxoprolinase subunit PxpB [Alteromonadaceae bacterium M269]
MKNNDFKLVVAGEAAVLVYFAEAASEKVLEDIQKFKAMLRKMEPAWLLDTIPSFTSMLIEYNPLLTDYAEVSRVIRELFKQMESNESTDNTSVNSIVELPVYYSEETGLDLASVASLTNLSIDEVIKIHSETLYQVYAVGFAPGFTYLGALNESLVLPRLKTPRLKVPKGSVAIAETQTAIYPNESPGGWHILGNCPIKLFDKDKETPMDFGVGDKVRFMPVSRDEFIALGGAVA